MLRERVLMGENTRDFSTRGSSAQCNFGYPRCHQLVEINRQGNRIDDQPSAAYIAGRA